MKILAIRIKNLASLEGITEIDFTAEPLCSAGIFAITGATGAGKSTILDALCLALYGKTPRYIQAKEAGIEVQDVQGSTLGQGDVRGILRDGCAEGFAEADFRGTDGQNYRATWSVRRARNKAEGSLQSDSVCLKNITSNLDVPGRKQETLNEIARLVGLSFDQFTRSVLLAQGDFSAFMKASKDEKSSLLERLTGTEIYSEISKKIFENYRSEEQQLRELNLRKDGIAILNDEELKAISEDQDTLNLQIKILEKVIVELTDEINWHEQLSNFQTSYDESQKAFLLAVEAKATALPRKLKLTLVDQAQQCRSAADALQRALQQHGDKAKALTELHDRFVLLDEQKEDIKTKFALADNEFAQKNSNLVEALPQLEEAKKLDVLLSEKSEQVVNLKGEVQTSSEAKTQHQTLLVSKKEEVTTLCDQIRSIADWKSENSDREAIAQNKDLILSKLQDAQKILEIVQDASEKLNHLQNKIEAEQAEKSEVEATWGHQSQNLEQLNKNFDVLAKELLLIPIEALTLNKSETDFQIENILRAQAKWQVYYVALEELNSLNQKQVQDKADHKIKQEALSQLIERLPVEKAQKDICQELLQQARLASAESVETLRATLVDNMPCPVCGSINHPYALHNPQLEKVLIQLEKSFEETEQVYLASYRRYSALQQECDTLNQTIERQNENAVLKQESLQAKKQDWEQFDTVIENDEVTDEKKAAWFNIKLQSLKDKQAALVAEIEVYAGKKNQLESDKARISQLKDSTNILASQIKDIISRLAVYQEQRTNKTNEQDKANADLVELERMLSPYFVASDWMENRESNPIGFVERIEAFAQKWTDHNEKLEQYIGQKVALEATLKELENQGIRFSSEASKKMESYLTQHSILLGLSEERQSIFEGHPADEIETLLKTAVSAAQQHVQQLKEDRQKLDLEITKAQTQKEELVATITALETDAKASSQEIQDWLTAYNEKNNQTITNDALLELLVLDDEWRNMERAALQTLEEEVTKASSILAERNQTLDSHKQKCSSEQSLDELIILSNSAKSEAELKKNKKGENSFRLQQDDANKIRLGDLLQSIAAQVAISENWSKLNEIIGSADGKKFRQIAQEYTLDVLLGYANIHLQILTRRYKIERIPGTLGLQVVDQDMGNEVRTVFSLSGGESFLVSLALALGLASLSTSRMKVESLFIDEGFGSLDPNTLNIAMDALERLHNQGRKVGVISHVQEMTERIPVQITVSKQQSGKSKVEVCGF
ncbi:MAG TPA: AAA family ATPase [Pedobacter sp.]